MKHKSISFKTEKEDEGARVDSIINKKYSDLSRNFIHKLCLQKLVSANDKVINKNYRVRAGEVISFILPEEKNLKPQGKNIPLDILYEDNDIIVINKPKGMVVHPGAGMETDTLVNALIHHCGIENLSDVNGEFRPGIVHRLDKDTSGVLVAAKNNIAHISLSERVKEHGFTRFYVGICYGNVKNDGIIEANIARHPVYRKKMSVCREPGLGRYACTEYFVIENYQGFTHLRFRLITGRTHQIRVHMAHIGHPIAGDSVYGPKKVISSLQGQCLHAERLGFNHPLTNKYMEFEAPVPPVFDKFLKCLKPQ